MGQQQSLATRPHQQQSLRQSDGGDNQLAAAALGTGATLERMQTPYCTAIRVQVKRDIHDIERQAVAEAALMGESFFYGWTVKTKDRGRGTIEGLSTDGAKVLQRIWGNNAVDVQVVDESDTHWTFKAVFIDLESGVTIPRLFKQRKPRSAKGDIDLDRFEDMEFQMGQSKAVRNVIKDALPKWLTDRCIESAKRTATGAAAKNPEAEKEEIIERATALGLTGGRLARKMGKQLKDYSVEDIVTAKALLTTIEQGHAPRDIIFPPAESKAQEKASVASFDAQPDTSQAERQPGDDEDPPDFDDGSDAPPEADGTSQSEAFPVYATRIAQAGKADDEVALMDIGKEIKASQERGGITPEESAELKDLWKRTMDGVWKRTKTT